MKAPKFIQIATGTQEGLALVFGLDKDGRVWVLYSDSSTWVRLDNEGKILHSGDKV